MSVWDTYQKRREASGGDLRTALKIREMRFQNTKAKSSLSYFTVTVDGVERNAMVIDTDILNEKQMLSMAGEDFDLGGLVYFADHYWLITEKDYNNELYTKVKIEQCNYELKWIDTDGVVHQQWAIVNDGTKLKRLPVRNSLVCWKQQIKTTSLIAGNSLEPSNQNRTTNSRIWQWFKNWMDWTISSQASNRGRFNDYLQRESRLRPKQEALS